MATSKKTQKTAKNTASEESVVGTAYRKLLGVEASDTPKDMAARWVGAVVGGGACKTVCGITAGVVVGLIAGPVAGVVTGVAAGVYGVGTGARAAAAGVDVLKAQTPEAKKAAWTKLKQAPTWGLF